MVLGKESRPLLSSISSRCPGASPRPAPLHQQRRADGTPGVLSRTGAEVRLYRAQRHTLMIASASSSRQNSVDVGEQRDMSDDVSELA